MSGTLYIVATPIGNLEDITLRALDVLKEVDLILAEDTRRTGVLLNHYDISHYVPRKKRGSLNQKKRKTSFDKEKTLLSYHAHSGKEKKLNILKRLLDGQNLALVTDAGTPGISDPGNELIDFLHSTNPEIKVTPVAGASAITTALSVSGFRTNNFVFLGFLPKKKRSKLFDWLKESPLGPGKGVTFAFYESPKRIIKTLEMLERVFGKHKRAFVGRELTKMHEAHYRGTFSEVIEKLRDDRIKGEIVVVVEG